MPSLILAAALLLAPALISQTAAPLTYNSIRTPEIQLGSGTTPTTITVYPVVEISGEPSEPPVSNPIPANTALLASRHFDFIVSPSTELSSPHGNMADTSISLGEYARQLRARRHGADSQAAPDSISHPTDAR